MPHELGVWGPDHLAGPYNAYSVIVSKSNIRAGVLMLQDFQSTSTLPEVCSHQKYKIWLFWSLSEFYHVSNDDLKVKHHKHTCIEREREIIGNLEIFLKTWDFRKSICLFSCIQSNVFLLTLKNTTSTFLEINILGSINHQNFECRTEIFCAKISAPSFVLKTQL